MVGSHGSGIIYTTITNDHNYRGGGEPWKWWVFPCVEVDTAKRTF